MCTLLQVKCGLLRSAILTKISDKGGDNSFINQLIEHINKHRLYRKRDKQFNFFSAQFKYSNSMLTAAPITMLFAHL